MRLSERHGVNPSISTCFYCGGDKNELVLCGRLKNDEQAPMKVVYDKEPCDKCKEYMAMGIIVISVKDGETDKENPYRTGGWAVIREEVFNRIPDGKKILNGSRVCFIEDAAWDIIGLPRS